MGLRWVGAGPIGGMLPWTQVRWIGEYRGAAADALQIVAWRAAGYSVTRRNCEGYGMARRRWVWAVGLLKLARVLGNQVGSAGTFLIEDVGECAEAFERTVELKPSCCARYPSDYGWYKPGSDREQHRYPAPAVPSRALGCDRC